MIGHWVGCLAEVAIKVNICSNLSPTHKDLCKSSTVFVHELVVEPLTNALVVMMVKSAINYRPGVEPGNRCISLVAGAVASLYLGKVTELVPDNYKPQFFTDYEAWIEGVLSLPGNFFGEALYEKIGHHNNLAAVATLGGLVLYKVYSNLYLHDERACGEEPNAYCYVYPWDDNTCPLSEQY